MIILILMSVWLYAVTALTQALMENYTYYLQESECVEKHVKLGVQRSRIVTTQGSCYVD